MREVISAGKTVEEATENGCAQLGLGRDEVSVEILEMPQKKLFKSTPAKVKVTADRQPEAEAPSVKPLKTEVKKPPEMNRAAPLAGRNLPKAMKTPLDSKLLPAEPEVPIDLNTDLRARQAADYMASILTGMGVTGPVITAARQGDATLIRVEGDTISEKMEIRGEVIQALSYLIDRSVNADVDKKEDGYLRIRLDIAGYRNRRECELMLLAQRTGSEVARTGRSRTLAPMNPYERLIVHTAISKFEGVTSESIGSDLERRVVIKSVGPGATDGDDWRPPHKGNRSEGGRDARNKNSRGGHAGRDHRRDDRRPPLPRTSTPEREYAGKPRNPGVSPVVPERREAIKDDDDLPLYGKFEL